MNDRVQDKIKGAREVLALLSAVKSLPRKDLEEYIALFGFSAPQIIGAMSQFNLLSSNKDGTISECRGAEGSTKALLCFRAAKALSHGKAFYLREAAYPFDFIVSCEGKNYLFLYFNDGGSSRLMFYNHMKKEDGEGPVLVLIFVNQTPDGLYETDLSGKRYLVPEEPFTICRISYKNDSQMITFREAEGRKDG